MIDKMMVAPQQRVLPAGAGGLPYMPAVMPTAAPTTAAPAAPVAAPVAAPITANTTMTTTGLPVQSPSAQVPPTGLIGSEAALTQGQNAALSAINDSYWMARNESDQYRKALNNRTLSLDTTLGSQSVDAINQGVAAYDPYTKGGANAQKLYDDMTGVNGAEAQAAAQAAYQSSPALKYQMDQMQKATERSAAARGGLMSGSVLQELQRNAQGLASQDYFKNLGAIGESANRGLNAASGVAGLRGQQAQLGAQLQSAGLQAQAQFEMQKESIRNDVANRLTNLAENRGLTVAGLQTGFGQALASGRTNAGMAMAQNATQAAGNIAQYLNQQGIGVSDMMNKDISSITDFMYQSGMQDKADMQNLADLIARINGAQGATAMQGQKDLAAAKAAGTLGVGNAFQQGVTQGISAGLFDKSGKSGTASQPVGTIGTGSNYGGYV
jgi:hypothetical protein